jgi:hypothetical protein
MRSNRVSDAFVVYGAPGVIGRRVCVELAKAGAPLVIAGRRAPALNELARTLPVAGVHVVEVSDPTALAAAFAGAKVVINAAGPLGETASPVLTAALAAGAHYIDVGGEQAVLAQIAERHDAAARKAGRVALPGAGVDCALGDLAAAWAAAHVVGGGHDDGAPVRDAPAARLADAQPIEDIAVSYVFDHLALSAGSQRALFQAIGSRTLIWRRDRWEPGRAGDHRPINAGPAFGGEREAQAFAAGDPLTIPRHVAALRVGSYLSTTRRARTATALRLLSRALPFVPHRVSELLEPYAEPGADYGRTQFAIIAQVRRGFAAAQVSVTGHDLYRTTAVIAAWCAQKLVERTTGPVGIRAPGELFRAAPALRAIASAADLTIEPSFGEP